MKIIILVCPNEMNSLLHLLFWIFPVTNDIFSFIQSVLTSRLSSFLTVLWASAAEVTCTPLMLIIRSPRWKVLWRYGCSRCFQPATYTCGVIAKVTTESSIGPPIRKFWNSKLFLEKNQKPKQWLKAPSTRGNKNTIERPTRQSDAEYSLMCNNFLASMSCCDSKLWPCWKAYID